MGTIINTTYCAAKMLGCCRATALVFAALLLTACNSASKEDVTYHIDFVVDGTPYGATTKYAWYHAENFEYSFDTVNFNNAFIHGTLKDGTKYIASSYDTIYDKYGRTKVDSRIYLQITPTLVESFDKTHTHSSHHTVLIVDSYADIGNRHRVWYHSAVNAQREHGASVRDASYYYTVGAKVTPFKDAKRALDDFFNMGPPSYPVPRNYKRSEFSFHPNNAHIGNSDADISFNSGSFDVAFPISGRATTWVLAPHVHVDGIGISGSRPDIAINLQNERIVIPSTAAVNAGVDPATGKAVVFYEDDASLRF